MSREIELQIKLSHYHLSLEDINKVFNQLEQCVWEQLCEISKDQLEKEVLDHNFGDLNRIMLPIEDEDLSAAKKRFQIEIFYAMAEERISKLKNKSS